MWREGLAGTALSVDYQRILAAIDDRIRLGQGPLTCQEMATAFGLDVLPAKVEGLRSKAKRLVSRDWLAEGVDHQFRIPPGTGSGRTTEHSASVMSEGYRRTRSGWPAAFPNR